MGESQLCGNVSPGKAVLFPKGPYTAHVRTLVPKTIPGMAFGTRLLKWAVYGPFGVLLILLKPREQIRLELLPLLCRGGVGAHVPAISRVLGAVLLATRVHPDPEASEE